MRRLLLIAFALAPTLVPAAPEPNGAPTYFASAKDAARFLRDHLGVDNPGGPLAMVGRRLAEQLAKGFDLRSLDGPGAEEFDDDVDDVRPDVDGFRAAPRTAKREMLPSERALDELRRAYDSGILAKTVRRTLSRLARHDGTTPITVRTAILRVRTDKVEYRALVEALSRDILTAASAELVTKNEELGVRSEPVVIAERVPASAAAASLDSPAPVEDLPALPGWPWLLGAACAILALSFHNLLRGRRRTNAGNAPHGPITYADHDRFDSVTQVRPVRPGVHERDDK